MALGAILLLSFRNAHMISLIFRTSISCAQDRELSDSERLVTLLQEIYIKMALTEEQTPAPDPDMVRNLDLLLVQPQFQVDATHFSLYLTTFYRFVMRALSPEYQHSSPQSFSL